MVVHQFCKLAAVGSSPTISTQNTIDRPDVLTLHKTGRTSEAVVPLTTAFSVCIHTSHREKTSMTDAWDYDETENDQLPNANGPKALRDYAKSQKERADAMAAEIAAIKAELNKAKVADLFEAQGVARAAAKYYSGDADPEKVTSWVNDMRGAFGSAPAPAQPVATPTVSPTDQAQIKQMMQAGADGATPSNYDVAHQSIYAAENTADRVAAFQAMLRQTQQG